MVDIFTRLIAKSARETYLTGPGGDLASHIGLFMITFGIAEMLITSILLFVLGYKFESDEDAQKVDILIKGMDARVKCHRLRLAAASFRPMGKRLSERLEHFERTCIPLRNKISHCWPQIDAPSQHIHFTTIAEMPDSMDFEAHTFSSKHKTIHLDELMATTMWINFFCGDLLKTASQVHNGGELEVSAPMSHLPKAIPRGSRGKAAPTNPDTQRQKPSRTED